MNQESSLGYEGCVGHLEKGVKLSPRVLVAMLRDKVICKVATRAKLKRSGGPVWGMEMRDGWGGIMQDVVS